jgi:hypothetical protein
VGKSSSTSSSSKTPAKKKGIVRPFPLTPITPSNSSTQLLVAEITPPSSPQAKENPHALNVSSDNPFIDIPSSDKRSDKAKKLFEEHLAWAVAAATEKLRSEFDRQLREARWQMERQLVDFKYKLEEEADAAYQNRKRK